MWGDKKQLDYSNVVSLIHYFGRFKTGFDMELYNYNDDKPYYLSKSFNGRNIEGIDTIRYELFPIDFSLQELQLLKEIFAEIVTMKMK